MFKQNLRPKKWSEQNYRYCLFPKSNILENGQEVLKISKSQIFHFFRPHSTPEETATLDVRKLAEKVVASWKYEKKDKLALEI